PDKERAGRRDKKPSILNEIVFEYQPLSEQDQVEADEEEQGRRHNLAELAAEEYSNLLRCPLAAVSTIAVDIGPSRGVQRARRLQITVNFRMPIEQTGRP